MLLLHACQWQDADEVVPEQELKKLQVISVAQEPHLGAALARAGYGAAAGTANSRLASAQSLVTDKIIKVKQDDGLSYSYSFLMPDISAGKLISNLVLKQVKGGYLAFILEFKASDRFYYNSKGRIDYSKFSGTISKFDLDGALLKVLETSNGYAVRSNNLANARVGQECFNEVVYYEYEVCGNEDGDFSSKTGLPYGECETVAVISTTSSCGETGGLDSDFWGDSGTYIPGESSGDPYYSGGSGGTSTAPGTSTPTDGEDPTTDEPTPVLIGIVEPEEPILIRDIEKDSTLVQNQKANCIYDKLGGNTAMKSLVTEYEDNGGTVNLTYKVGTLSDGTDVKKNGQCDPVDNTFKNIVITLDENYIATARTIQVARTFLHESVHAKIFSYLRQIGGYEHLDKDNFPVMYEAYVEAKKSGVSMDTVTNRVHHEEIAKHYVELIAKGLQEFDTMNHNNPEVTIEHYRALAWDALRGTTAWNNLMVEQQKKIDDDRSILLIHFSILTCTD